MEQTKAYNELTRHIAENAAGNISNILRGHNVNISEQGQKKIEETFYRMLVDFRQSVLTEKIRDETLDYIKMYEVEK